MMVLSNGIKYYCLAILPGFTQPLGATSNVSLATRPFQSMPCITFKSFLSGI